MESSSLRNLFPPQAELLGLGFVESKEDWLISAPTGAGKTRMAEWAMDASVKRGHSCAYVAPLKSILEERYDDWRSRKANWEVGMFTGESTRKGQNRAPTSESVLLFTPEKLAGYLQNWKRNLRWIAGLDAVVLDEVHMLGDPGRGSTLESLVTRLRRVNPYAKIVGMSGTMSNCEEIANWLNARLFRSDWRPVPVESRIRRFRRASEKNEILIDEINKTVASGGQVLVFVNSRRRCEAIAEQINARGFSATANHAGLSSDARQASQEAMRSKYIEVLVATSTLEMGVNFPARKVIVFDAYGFDGEHFAPMPIARFRQYAGRAGRAGYDDCGESVLLLPHWHREGDRYLHGTPEPVRSALFSTPSLTREILIETTTRLSITEDHLDTNFASSTLWRTQDGKRSLSLYIRHLVTANLLKQRENEEAAYLTPTALGRIAVQMSVSPNTAVLLADCYHEFADLTEFDLLLTVCLCKEVTPKLGFCFEEIDLIGDLLNDSQSRLLDAPTPWFLRNARGIDERSLLSAVKCACILWQLIDGAAEEQIAAEYDTYVNDLALLRKNACWALEVCARVFGVTARSKDEDGVEHEIFPEQKLATDVKLMVEYGLPRHAISLTRVPGIGPKRARSLSTNGISNLQTLLATPPADLQRILGLRENTITRLLAGVEQIAGDELVPEAPASHHGTQRRSQLFVSGWPEDIDPYRLRRALELVVEHASGEAIRVSGGSEPHVITINSGRCGDLQYACDCPDFGRGTRNCKHVLRARLEHNDRVLLDLLATWARTRPKVLRHSIAHLWIRTAKLFDKFHDRSIDYAGNRFLAGAHHRRHTR